MVRKFAPRVTKVRPWLVLLVPFATVGQAQPPVVAPPPAAEKAAPAVPKAQPGDPAAAVEVNPLADAATAQKSSEVEVYKDPRADKVLPNTFPELRPPANFRAEGRGSEVEEIRSMAGGGVPDRDKIQRYVDYFASELTSHKNIKALMEPGPVPKGVQPKTRSDQARAIDRATTALLDPLVIARETRNTAFVDAYGRSLLATLPKLLDGQFFARIQAMIVLGTLGSPDAIDLEIKQLNNPEQVVWVKLWAARGITEATQEGRAELRDQQKGFAAAKALVGFLAREPEAPWPVQVRALEALGSLRLANLPLPPTPDMAATALVRLADPKAKLDVRAWAGWALGMMRVGPQVNNYNYALITYHLGLAAAAIGDRIATDTSRTAQEAQRLTGLLLYQIYPAFKGVQGVRNSGILSIQGAGLPTTARPLADQISALALAAVDVTRSANTQLPAKRAEVAAKVASLRAYLETNKPKEETLVPGGPKFAGP